MLSDQMLQIINKKMDFMIREVAIIKREVRTTAEQRGGCQPVKANPANENNEVQAHCFLKISSTQVLLITV